MILVATRRDFATRLRSLLYDEKFLGTYSKVTDMIAGLENNLTQKHTIVYVLGVYYPIVVSVHLRYAITYRLPHRSC